MMSKTKVTNLNKKMKTNEKRFRLPCIVESECPHCKEVNRKDMTDHYLSYPTINQYDKIHFCCKECDEEFSVELILRVRLETV